MELERQKSLTLFKIFLSYGDDVISKEKKIQGMQPQQGNTANNNKENLFRFGLKNKVHRNLIKISELFKKEISKLNYDKLQQNEPSIKAKLNRLENHLSNFKRPKYSLQGQLYLILLRERSVWARDDLRLLDDPLT